MKLVSDWRWVLRYAWSIRLLIAAGILTGLEAVLPYLADTSLIPDRWFRLLMFVVTIAAFMARIISQKDSRNE
ncbi:hypothetical protein [Brucella sp. 191011898]|uniref:DUF7940 domain-containing protein n=1 Tax=Brucella sp. 191011898 TaxID=2730447 RepID=UPI0015DD8F3E|nr:hypothetical protein [Brucella sp. 191011898]CAB4326609.1 hypothetical protein BCH_01955 [Brucella sp. 191011898]